MTDPIRAAEGDGPRLYWTENMPPSESCRYDHCIAETPFGRFLITWKSWKKYDSPTVDETPWGDWYGAFNSIDAAKSSCQQEFNKRLARCGHQSTLSADDIPPAVTISALLHPAYEPGGSEADGAQLIDLEWWQPVMGCDSLQMVVDNARNILSSRWSSPAPMPVAKGDVGGLVAWLLEEAEQAANSDASHSAGMLTWAAQVVGEHAELLQQQQEQVKRLKDELADERMRLSACFRIAICDTPETAPRARDEYREHYWSPAAGAIAQKIDELIRLRKRFFEEAENWRQIAEQIELFYSRQTNAVEALKRLRQWGRLCGYSYNSDVVLGVVDWIDGGMVGELPPLPSHALPQPQGEVK